MSEEIGKRLADVRARIHAAAARSGRGPESVQLVAVTKTIEPERIRAALDAGVAILGENRVQEARAKIPALPAAEWHLIGHLQTNKARLALDLFSLIHSLDALRLAEELDQQARRTGSVARCLVEVNVGGEAQKSGVAPGALGELLQAVRRLAAIRVEGLMTVPPWLPDPEAVRPCFRQLRQLRDRFVAEAPGLRELSMGMSHDFEVAIEEGATMVRIGTAIFGPRKY